MSNWRSMESAPKDGTSILTHPHWRITHWTDTECLTDDGSGWAGSWDDYVEGFSAITPTHWMPLPPAPGQQPATEQPSVAEAARVREFLSEFASYKFDEVRNFSGPSPEDELEATTEYGPVSAFQEDAQSLLESAFPKRCKDGDIDAFNGDCLWCGAPMGGTCQDPALRTLQGDG